MKRVLIITYYWPPTGGSGVQRWVKFSKYLPEYGWQPVIYTPDNPERLAQDESLLSDVPSCAEILKTKISEPYAIYKRLMGQKTQINPINSQKKSLKQKLSLWLRGNLFIPDPRCLWIRPSLSYLCSYLKEHPVDVIITTGPPHSMHLIGRNLKRRLGIRWIADFRDPWTEMFYFKHLGLTKYSEKRHRLLEQSVLDEADLVISVAPRVRADFQSKTKTPVELITNGFDQDDFSINLPSKAFVDKEFRIVHTGLFASDGNPENLWTVLSKKCAEDPSFKKALKIRLAGKVDSEIVQAIEAKGLGDKLVLLGYLPHSEIVKEQRLADILILPLRQEPEYAKVLPGKIFEYLAAARPVLGIGQEDGSASEVLRDVAVGEMYDWEEEDKVCQFIDKQWSLHLQGNRSPVGKNIEKYSRRALTRSLVKIL